MLKLERSSLYYGKVSTIRTYRFHELKLQVVSGHASKTRHYQLWDEVTFNSNRDPRWYSRRVKETLNSINRDSGIENSRLIRGCLQSDTEQYNRTADR